MRTSTPTKTEVPTTIINPKKMRYFILLIMLVAVSCQSSEEAGHAHDAQGNHVDAGPEIPTMDATVWTDKTELFVEFPALVVDQTSRFAAHFTVLDNHQPVREGTVTVSLIHDGKGVRQTVAAPASPGIFTPSLQPKSAGTYQLIFDIKTPAYEDRIVLNDVPVFASIEEAINTLGNDEEAGGAITFLKEQAWKIDFQTAPVVEGEVYDVIHTSGVWQAAPGAFKSLTASASGIAGYAIDNLTEGAPVKQGQLLMTVSSEGLTSDNLSAEIEQARANYEQAKAEYDRKQQLYASEIVPRAEFEQVENRYRVAKSAYETLQAGYSAGGKQVRAPFGGFIKSIRINNGEYVDQGATLVTIGSHQSRLLETHASPADAAALRSIHNLWYQPETGKWSNLNESGGSILSVGKEVEADQPLLLVYAQVNEEVEMPEGSFTEVQIAVGDPQRNPLVPEAALLEDYGSFSVIVQLSGESFERRPVKIGRRNGDYVEVREGLTAGEVVVTEGAYQVKMAAMSGQTPAHGHEH